MKHRHLKTEEWTRTAIASLFERGTRPDWEEFVNALRKDKNLAGTTLAVCANHTDIESANLARVLVMHFYNSEELAGAE